MTRPDQSPFANEVRENCHHRCVVTGASLRCITEAAHLTPHCDRGIPEKTNGLLLRRDIHALFDSHEFAINPDTLRLYFTKAARGCLNTADLTVRILNKDALKTFINPENLRARWEKFRRLHHAELACESGMNNAD
ncbi:HNH endonuclease signature motif containing protein [Erwinia tasmaniensis]|nr:HNH endonuclease signature motif containing protein [Erwinia tasmaniensis]